MTVRAESEGKTPVLGLPISMTSIEEVMELFRNPPSDRAAIVSVCNVHSVMSARRDPPLSDAIRSSDIATPDGMPLVWAIRAMSNPDQVRVAGPDLMHVSLERGSSEGLRHFFYGTTPETLTQLVDVARVLDPAAQIVGTIAPPFGSISDEELDTHVVAMRGSGANVVWVGLGMPKQELWMARAAPALSGMTLIGVGAAFDIIAGNQPRAPLWMQRAGLEWLFRLGREPRRLWKRYFWNNPAFLALFGVEWLRARLGRSQR